ncbi:MAG: integrin alpha, partial [Candidatus Sumerlaeota bacterium]
MKSSRKNEITVRAKYPRRINRSAVMVLMVAALSAGVAIPVSAGIPANVVNVDTLQSGGGSGFAITTNKGHNDQAGFSVSAAGDVNGDGLGDFIIGAPNYGNSFSFGRAFVLFGKTDTEPISLSNFQYSPSGGFMISLDGSGETGASVSAAGDVNGDGLADIIVGAPNHNVVNPGYSFARQAGRAYVIYGKKDTNPVNLTQVGIIAPGFILEGSSSYQYLGYSVSGAGDVNGDGFADVVVGAPDLDRRGSVGNAYVVFGGSALPGLIRDTQVGTIPGFVISGFPNVHGETYFGYSVSGAGDFNGDGLSDIVVGAPGAYSAGGEDPLYSAGRVIVIPGKTSTTPIDLSGPDYDNCTAIAGNRRRGQFGVSVSTAGDTDGDGFSDIIAGTKFINSYTPADFPDTEGHAAVLRGGPNPIKISIGDLGSDPDSDGFLFGTHTPDTLMGRLVSLASDMNGDGRTDVIVGQPKGGSCGYGCSTGQAYVVFSPPRGGGS